MSKEATRDALLTAARSEFAAYGIAGARVDRIAERAGVNKERIYGYFGSKEKLFDQVMESVLDEMAEVVAMPGDDPIDYVGKIHDFYLANPELTRLLMWESLHYREDALEGQHRRIARCAAKAESLAAGLGREPSPEVSRTMMTLIGLAAWPMVMPRLGRIVVGEEFGTEEGHRRMREHLVDFVRTALNHAPPGAADGETRENTDGEPGGNAEPVSGRGTAREV
ncbi:TetR family transcriptional regulator [Streptosporangium sp. NPDC051023]|uniref:TetR/AcrR family transcriptional regulator n=1 Tax=Streptosporangium sp. NPDC051023 TaxID=3155410 RepID=UPI00344FB8E2